MIIKGIYIYCSKFGIYKKPKKKCKNHLKPNPSELLLFYYYLFLLFYYYKKLGDTMLFMKGNFVQLTSFSF